VEDSAMLSGLPETVRDAGLWCWRAHAARGFRDRASADQCTQQHQQRAGAVEALR
jgi:hypothetical protein